MIKNVNTKTFTKPIFRIIRRNVFYKNYKNVHGTGREMEERDMEHGHKTEKGKGSEKEQETLFSGNEEERGILYDDATRRDCSFFICLSADAGIDYCVSGL